MFTLQPGRLKEVQAIGWYLEEANMAQVSVNITDYDQTAIHTVYEEVCKDAEVNHFTVTYIPDKLQALFLHDNQNTTRTKAVKFICVQKWVN